MNLNERLLFAAVKTAKTCFPTFKNDTHWAVTRIQRNCLKYKVSRYQLLQRVRTQDKVRCTFFLCSSIQTWRRRTKLYSQNCVYCRSHYQLYWWHVNRHNAKIVASSHPSTVIWCTAAGPESDIFWCLSKHNVFIRFFCLKHCEWCSEPRHARGIPHTECVRRS